MPAILQTYRTKFNPLFRESHKKRKKRWYIPRLIKSRQNISVCNLGCSNWFLNINIYVNVCFRPSWLPWSMTQLRHIQRYPMLLLIQPVIRLHISVIVVDGQHTSWIKYYINVQRVAGYIYHITVYAIQYTVTPVLRGHIWHK